MTDFTDFLQHHAREAQRIRQYRQLPTIQQEGVYVMEEGQRLLSFRSNDYLGIAHTLAHRPAQYPMAGAGASRIISGTDALVARVEARLAQMKGTEAALLFGSGYLANIGIIPALVRKGDLVLMDRYAHACMIDGVRLSGARAMRFRHHDMTHLGALLTTHRAQYRHCLILTETIFSMDGDAAPLAELYQLAQAHGCWLMTDDAHGIGLPHLAANPAEIQMGTLSKAVGMYGGYVCGSALLIRHCINHARSMMFSTALPPALIAGIEAALQIMRDEPDRAMRVMSYAAHVANALGVDAPDSPIIPVILGDNQHTLEVQAALRTRGLSVAAIRPPTVARGTARLRISLSAAHQPEHIEQLLDALTAMELTSSMKYGN
ncbi:MAG: 8-amino-7-oxononanoate synthase [Sphaerospermopsis sp. SIO1G2]|nr:8-amino-7-oxononanoate synthase [Sphaerospermopsis sp. SIO1G2]